MTIPDNASERYQTDGFLSGLEIFSTIEISEYRRQFDELESLEEKEYCQTGLTNRHFDSRFIWDLATNPILLELMQVLMGEDVMLLSTHFFCKYPDDDVKNFVAWHQDITYWNLVPEKAESAWIAIDDSYMGNGCMQVIQGSHLQGKVSHSTSTRPGNLLSINQEIPQEEIDLSKVYNLCLKAGQVSIHTGMLFHSSKPNLSKRRRCGLAVRFISPEVQQIEPHSRGWWKPVLVRGHDYYGNFARSVPPFPFKS